MYFKVCACILPISGCISLDKIQPEEIFMFSVFNCLEDQENCSRIVNGSFPFLSLASFAVSTH